MIRATDARGAATLGTREPARTHRLACLLHSAHASSFPSVKPEFDAYRRRDFLTTMVLSLGALGPAVLAVPFSHAAVREAGDIVVDDTQGVLVRDAQGFGR